MSLMMMIAVRIYYLDYPTMMVIYTFIVPPSRHHLPSLI